MEIEFLNYTHCYQYGEWCANLPFTSICGNCKVNGVYCALDNRCPNRWRDNCFWTQYQLENDSDYYPSDMDTTNFSNRRILKLKAVAQKPYYYSGQTMWDSEMLCNAYDNSNVRDCDKEEAMSGALEEIAKYGYKISIKRFKAILRIF